MSERLLLELEHGSQPPAELPRSGTLVIGSDATRASFVVKAPGVLEVHAAIARNKSGGWAIRDLGSDSGVWLNDKRVESAALAAGDQLRIGSARLRIVDPAVQRPAPSAPTPPSVVAPTPSAALPSFPGYRTERRLGKGGMGEVYLAIQERLARPVALKVLAPRFGSDESFVKRFEAEARAAAALNHPNVVTVYDVGFHAGLHFLSMEYMDRGTLEDRLQKSGRLPWKDVLAILKDAGSGLAYAESKGIVHRDLKPANLMQNAAGATKIADLGLATHIEAEAETEALAAGERKIFGTAHFMSPEQARGEKLDHRSDLYSLGATAYRLLSGTTPYEAPSSKEILRALLREDPRPLASLTSAVPPALIGIIEALMRRDLAQRTRSATELLSAIAAFERGGAAPSSAAQPSPAKWVIGAAALLGVGWLGWKLVSAPPPSPQPAALQPTVSLPTPPVPAEPETSTTAQTNTPAPQEPERPNDERELELLESKARIALLEILSRQETPEEKIAALVEMARKFHGTTAASEASTKANELETALRSQMAAASERHAAILALAQQLRQAAGLGAQPPTPGKGLLAMRAVAGQAAYENDPVFLSERARIEQELLSEATDYAKRVLEETQKDLEAGQQERAQAALTALISVFDLPEYPLGQAPAGVDALQEQGRRARERLSNLRAIAGQIQDQRQRQDLELVARTLHGPEGLERELSQLDFGAAAQRVRALSEQAATIAVRQSLADLTAELEEAARAFEILVREFPAGWKRKGVDDPRDRTESLRNCVGADAQGLLLEVSAGGTERVPWSAFGNHSKELGRLFTERLTREFKTEEARSIRNALQFAAVAEALSLGAKMLDPSKKANFTEGNAKELLECFGPAQAWVSKAGSSPSLVREMEAAQLLTRVWLDTTNEAISAAVAGTERLLAEYPDTLLVRLLSDGSGPNK